MSDQLELLRRAAAAAGGIVHGVPRQRWRATTPCPDWDVWALLNHMVAGNVFFSSMARGAGDMSVWGRDHLGDDPTPAWDSSAAAAQEAWREPGALERTATLPSGQQGPHVADMYLMELFGHGWDLATATDQPTRPDPDVTQAVFDAWYGRVPEEVRAGGRVVGPELPCPSNAPVADRILAYLGRGA